MKKTEIVKLLTILKVTYPKFFISNDDEETGIQIDTWYAVLKDDDFGIVQQATFNLIKTLKFPPTIADIKEAIRKIQYPNTMTEQEAVNFIMKALEDGYYNSRKAFDCLPEILRKVVGSPSQLAQWSVMEIDTVQSVVASNISRSYRVLLERELERQKTNPLIAHEEIKQLNPEKPLEKKL